MEPMDWMEVPSFKNSQNHSLSTVTVLQLPNELLELIFKHLSGCDVISFALTCKRFSSLCQSVTHLNLENDGTSLGQPLPLIKVFFRRHVNPTLLRSCNLNGCYWIDAQTLGPFLIKCTNLIELHLAETKLSLRDIVSGILPKCSKITKLSFTLTIGKWASFSRHLGDQKLPTLCRLKSVEIIVSDANFEKKSHLNEAISFLRSCENVEEIVICKLRLSQLDRLYPRTLFRNPNILKGVVLIAEPFFVFVERLEPPCQFYDIIEGSNLTTFWCNLLLLRDNNRNNLNSLGLAAIGDQIWNELPLNVLQPGLRLGQLESYWEPGHVLMRSVVKSPTKLKLISCFYNHENFQNFCENHPLLEVLKLGHGSNKYPSTIWDNRESWKNLARLRILSLDPTWISEQSVPILAPIFQSSPLIQELEIMGTVDNCPTITEEELSSIALLGPNLKRLTLANFSVKSGLFLEQILKSCDQLESLRLKELGTHEQCCYAANLITALPLAKNLKTFCLFQANVPKIKLLLKSLESCTCISRLSLVCPSKSDCFSNSLPQKNFISGMARFCEKMSRLVALFCSFSVPSEHCEEASKLIRERFKTERPAFRVDLKSTGLCDHTWSERIYEFYSSKEFPVMYKDLLTSFQSQVALFPYDCNTFLQRTL